MTIRINIGCGQTPTEGWRNFDNSPSIKLARSPIKFSILKLLRMLNEGQIENIEWNKKNSIEFADAAKRIPVPDESASVIYTSHMLEHLSREDAKMFLEESKRVLKRGGIIRISVPDINHIIGLYKSHKDADKLMTDMHTTAPPVVNIKDKIKLLVNGYRHHQWMYDGESLSKLMVDRGFHNVKVQANGESYIQQSETINLHERDGESVFVEGVK